MMLSFNGLAEIVALPTKNRREELKKHLGETKAVADDSGVEVQLYKRSPIVEGNVDVLKEEQKLTEGGCCIKI